MYQLWTYKVITYYFVWYYVFTICFCTFILDIDFKIKTKINEGDKLKLCDQRSYLNLMIML